MLRMQRKMQRPEQDLGRALCLRKNVQRSIYWVSYNNTRMLRYNLFCGRISFRNDRGAVRVARLGMELADEGCGTCLKSWTEHADGLESLNQGQGTS